MAQFVSFLGTGRYLQNVYQGDNDFESSVTRFAQVAILEMLLSEGKKLNEICLLLTKQARNKNYNDYNDDNNNYFYEGLKKVLANHEKLKDIRVKTVDIPSEQNEEDLWEIFEKLFKTLRSEDEVYFDITHSFRSIPLVALLVANFAKTINEIKVERVFYGNELKRPSSEGYNDPDYVGDASIVDITTMVNLLDWSTGVDSFIRTGNPDQIHELASKEAERNNDLKPISEFTEELTELNQMLQTNRAEHLETKIPKVKKKFEEIKKIDDSKLPQFSKLTEKIDKKLDVFTENKKENMWGTIKWCVDHGLYQQAYTLLREHIATVVFDYVYRKGCIKDNEIKSNDDYRKIRSRLIYIIENYFEKTKHFLKHTEPQNEELVKEVHRFVEHNEDVFRSVNLIRDYRNNINHAGIAQDDKLKHDKLTAGIEQFVKETKNLFR